MKWNLCLFLVQLLFIHSIYSLTSNSNPSIDLSVNSLTKKKIIASNSSTSLDKTLTNDGAKSSLTDKMNSKIESNKNASNSNVILSLVSKYKNYSTDFNDSNEGSFKLIKSKAKYDPSKLWSQLFSKEREVACINYKPKKVFENVDLSSQQIEIKKSDNDIKFNFTKKWGYGNTAFLIDFLDPVFLDDMVRDFSKIYNELVSISNEDNDEYQDSLKKKMQEKTSKFAYINSSNKNKTKDIFDLSINSVQINHAMMNWGWFNKNNQKLNQNSSTNNQKDVAMQFILDYDVNGDGRLNPRELIFGVIINHKGKDNLCYNCLLLIKKKLAAIFQYFDCMKKGYISNIDLGLLLSTINRDDKRWNVFSLNNNNDIKIESVNDFCLKNGTSRPGFINSEEFINGILLAFWDRQINDLGIIKDDSQSLRKLRWEKNDMNDIDNFEGVKDNEISKKIHEEEEKQRQLNLKPSLNSKKL